MKKILSLLIIALNLNLNAQILFEKGKITLYDNSKIECLIKNEDWMNTPSNIFYKLNESGEIKEASLFEIKGFEFENGIKFLRFNLDIDKSPTSIEKLSNFKEPKFENETVLVEVLVEGPTNLYMYKTDLFTRYFYNVTPNNEVKQLVFKNYVVPDGDIKNNEIFENNYYKQQIFNDLKCEKITIEEIQSLKYQRKVLTKLFEKYNDCKNPTKAKVEDKIQNNNQTDLKFRINIRPGITKSSLHINSNDPIYTKEYTFESKNHFRIGIETEMSLPFNKHKWSIILEPTYQRYYNETLIQPNQTFIRVEKSYIDYEYLELPIGLRYYIYLNKNSKLFLNYTFQYDYWLKGKISSMPTGIGGNVASGFGIGFSYKKFGIEYKYLMDKSIVNYDNLDLLTSSSIILSYNLFEFKK